MMALVPYQKQTVLLKREGDGEGATALLGDREDLVGQISLEGDPRNLLEAKRG